MLTRVILRLPLLIVIVALCLAARPKAPAALSEKEAAPKADAPSSTEPVKKELTKIIDEQLAAFRSDDYAKAFTYASEEIRGAIDVAQFEQMVRNGYPVIAKSTKAEFGLAFDTGEEAVVNVKVVGDAATVEYQYHLLRQKGVWRIGGVVALKKPGVPV